MRGALRHLPMPGLIASERSAVVDVVRVLTMVRRWVRTGWCLAIHGGHELYRARTDTRLFQQCLLCGYETPGWTIDRRDRCATIRVARDTRACAGRK